MLVADDSPVNRKLIADLLRAKGMHVDAAHDGCEAIDRVSESLPDAVIMSCQIPVMDAYQTARHLRERYHRESLILIAVSTEADLNAETRCKASGMDELLTKPIDASLLLERLEFHLLGNRAADGAQRSEPPEPGALPIDELLLSAGLDLQHGLAITAGDRTAYYELLRRFVTHHVGDGSRLAAHKDSAVDQDLVRIAHSLKGVSGNMGAREIRVLAELAEHGLRRGEDIDLADLGRRLDKCFCRIGAVLEQLPEDDQNSDLPAGESELADVEDALGELATLIRLHDIDAGQIAGELREQLAQPARDEFAPVIEALKGFKFESAQSLLREMTQSSGLSIKNL